MELSDRRHAPALTTQVKIPTLALGGRVGLDALE